jgi:hypothetical protein
LTPDVRRAVLEPAATGAYGESASRAAFGCRARFRGALMRRFAMAGAVLAAGTVLGVLAPVAGSTPAWADAPNT